ncbi:MAG: hypothetical protein Q7U84_05375, partial [Polynucleobacter sp.]|nr:hypothetical protein [Polynucleobacter sp.]
YLAGNPGCNLNFMKMFARLPRAWGAEGDAAFYRRLSSAVDMMVKHPALAEKVFKLAQTMGSEYMTNDAVREFDKRAHSEILEFKMRELPEGNERTEMTKYLYCCNVAIPAITEDMDTDWNPSEQIFEELRKRGVIHFDGPAVADHGPLDSDALKNACTEVRNRLNAFMDPADTTTGLAYKSKLAESDAERNAREARVEAVLEMAKDWRSVAVSNIHCRNRAVGEPPDDPNTRRALELYVWDGVPKQIAERVSVRILEQRVMGPENEEPGPSDTEIAAAAFNEIMAGCGIRTWVDEDKNFSVNDSANLDPGDTGRHDKPWAQVGGLATKNWHESPLLRSYLKVIEARRHAHEG